MADSPPIRPPANFSSAHICAKDALVFLDRRDPATKATAAVATAVAAAVCPWPEAVSATRAPRKAVAALDPGAPGATKALREAPKRPPKEAVMAIDFAMAMGGANTGSWSRSGWKIPKDHVTF